MATTIEIDATATALLSAMQPVMAPWGVDLTPEMILVKPYGGMDERIGWDTYIVTIEGHGVYGFTDGPLREPPNVRVEAPTTAPQK